MKADENSHPDISVEIKDIVSQMFGIIRMLLYKEIYPRITPCLIPTNLAKL